MSSRPTALVVLLAASVAACDDAPLVPDSDRLAEEVLATAPAQPGAYRSVLVLVGPDEMHFGGSSVLHVSGATAGSTVSLVYSLAGPGAGPCPPTLGGTCFDVLAPRFIRNRVADAAGIATFNIGALQAGPVDQEVHFQAVIAAGAASSESGVLTARLSPEAQWEGEGAAADEVFGGAVVDLGDVDGDGDSEIAVGAPLAGAGPGLAGRVDVWLGTGGTWAATPDWSTVGGIRDGLPVDEQLGFTLAAGDIDGDGYSDLVVGGHASSDPSPELALFESAEGRVEVFRGGPAGLPASPSWIVEGNSWAGYLGMGVAVGDFDGNGYDDVLAGSPGYTVPFVGMFGAAYAWYGDANGLPAAGPAATSPSVLPDWTSIGVGVGSYYGGTLATGDLNGDGYDDALVNAWYGSNGQASEGTVTVYMGSATGLDPAPAALLEGNQADAWFGGGMAVADVDGDGFEDAIVGALGWDGAYVDEGAVFVFRGGALGISTAPSWMDTSGVAGAMLGQSVAATDLDGDGIWDVVAGAHGWTGSLVGQGAVLAWYGGVGGPSGSPDWRAEGATAGEQLGYAIAGAGDLTRGSGGEILSGSPGSPLGHASVWSGIR